MRHGPAGSRTLESDSSRSLINACRRQTLSFTRAASSFPFLHPFLTAPIQMATPHADAAATAAAGAAASASEPAASAPVACRSPGDVSLFEQLQAAQASSGGTAAAAAILVAKSKELLGLSESPDPPAAGAAGAPPSLMDQASALVPLDADSRARLAREGEELRGFSEMLLAGDGGSDGTSDGVAGVWSTLASKYSASGTGLQNEALNLWTQLQGSSEASELGAASMDVLEQWKKYAATADGQKLLEQSGEMLKSQSSALAQLLANFSISSITGVAGATADAAAPSVSPTNADTSPSLAGSLGPSVSGSSEPARRNTPSPSSQQSASSGTEPLLQREALMKTTTKVTRALADDDDVKELLSKSSALIQSFGAEEGKAAASASASPAASPASAASASSTSSAAGAGDDVGNAALKGAESYIRGLRESDAGNKLLAKATVLLQSNRDFLRPEALTGLSSSLVNDLDARAQFITRVKDVALDFLLSYLPTVVVPPIAGEKDRVAYEISNIDLGGFKVDSDKVVVTIENGAIAVRATGIHCAMRNLIWSYKRQSFPKVGGKGTADANAADVEFVLKLKLAYPDKKQRKAIVPVARPVSSPAAAAAAPTAGGAGVAAPPAASESRSASLTELAAAAKDTLIAKTASASSSRRGSKSSDRRPSDAAAASSTTAAAAAAAASPATPAAAPAPAPAAAAPSLGESILSTVSTDLGDPKLVMHSCHVRLKAFTIEIHSGFMKSIYNFLLGIFSDSVKQYLEDTVSGFRRQLAQADVIVLWTLLW